MQDCLRGGFGKQQEKQVIGSTVNIYFAVESKAICILAFTLKQ